MRFKVFGLFLLIGIGIYFFTFHQSSIARERSLVYEISSPQKREFSEVSLASNQPTLSKTSSYASSGPSGADEPPPSSLPALSVDDPLVPTFSSGPSDSNQIALTFDDGPHPTITPKILDELRKRKIHATFFVLGDRVRMYPWIAQQIIAEGHEIGNHTYNHRLLTSLSYEAAEREITETHQLIKSLTGYETTLFRPPYGALRPDIKLLLNEKKFKVIMWSVDPKDWQVRDSERILTHVINHTRRGSIILCHDINKSTLEALPNMLDLLLEQGYEFTTVNKLCDLPTLKLVSTKE